MSTPEERREAREKALERDPSLRPTIGPRKPVQGAGGPGRSLDPLGSRRVSRKRPRLGPHVDPREDRT